MVAQMMSSSLGAMGPLLSNLQTLMVSPEHQLPNPLMEEIELLKQDLETINTCLINLSRSESPNRMAMHWMNEVRDLSYDMQDYIDSMMHPNKMSDYQMNQNILSVVKKFRSLVKQASERHESYELWRWASNPSYSMASNGQDPVLTPNGKAKQLVGIGESTDKLIKLLNTDSNDAGAQGHLKVVSILGPAGVGKSTLAKEVYREIGARFECLAFVRVSRMPDTRRLLRSIISQVQCHQRPLYGRSVQDLIDNLREHLQQKRYFIVIDDLWERTSWNIVKSAFPEDTNCSRILITTGIEKVALECCKSIRVLSSQATESEIYSNNHVRAQVGIYKVEPLSTEDSTELFFNEVFGSNHEHSNSSKEYSDEIIKMCGGLPLSIIMVANIFASQPDNAELWHHVKKYLKTSLENNFSTENMMREIVILSYNNLSHHLKTCLLHLNMYPEGCTFMKADLVKQWWAEGFVSAIAGKDINEVAECYFDELVGRGLIQPNHVSFSDEVIFYTVHSTVFEIIRNKSIEENFITGVDYSETITKLSAKVRRLYLSFSNAKYATKPKDITLSTVRSLTFYGPVQCLPSISEFKLLRVLILEFLVDTKDIDLSGIYRLFQLRYVRITTDDDNIVYLPPSMKGLKYLETLEVYARVKSIPSDIVHLPKLLHLRLQGEIKPPASVVHMKSVRTLQSFDLSSNSEDNIRQLGEMMDLQDLHLTCSTETSDLLEKNLIALASSLGKHGQLKSLVLEPGALRTSICLDCSSRVSSPPVSLQRLELLPPLCIFSRLPEWIGQLRKLCILRIVVMELTRDDVNRISGLQELTVLSLYVIQPIAESIIFSRAEFPVLKHFKLRCGILRLEFQAETMPKLRSLNLAFNAHSGEQYGDMIAGIENLLDLQGIIVQIGTPPGAEESDRMAAESVFKGAISRHSKPPSFSIRRADLVEEEYVPFNNNNNTKPPSINIRRADPVEEEYVPPNNNNNKAFKSQTGRGWLKLKPSRSNQEEIPLFSSPPVCFSRPEMLNRLTTANVTSEVNEIHVAHDNELRATSDQVSLTDQPVATSTFPRRTPPVASEPSRGRGQSVSGTTEPLGGYFVAHRPTLSGGGCRRLAMADTSGNPADGYYSGRPLGLEYDLQQAQAVPAPPLEAAQPQPRQDVGDQVANHTHVHGVPGYYKGRLSNTNTAVAPLSATAAVAPPPPAPAVEPEMKLSWIDKW
ncbi:unnamed protein product [Miscanthus lutarioriparius]|uniref:Uncharacterized protein n=1 Tax=Miscanthus lutarioriparius TaxID=422564 RepID=A0A811QEJ3_9POAL|nr:unnamed protein product [Miscanthus lutarioriparius]